MHAVIARSGSDSFDKAEEGPEDEPISPDSQTDAINEAPGHTDISLKTEGELPTKLEEVDGARKVETILPANTKSRKLGVSKVHLYAGAAFLAIGALYIAYQSRAIKGR